jgi:hypothetical protein
MPRAVGVFEARESWRVSAIFNDPKGKRGSRFDSSVGEASISSKNRYRVGVGRFDGNASEEAEGETR